MTPEIVVSSSFTPYAGLAWTDRPAISFQFHPEFSPGFAKALIAERYDSSLGDRAICHRNIDSGDSQCVFISTRLLDDRFSIAFEFYINVGHAFVDKAGVSAEFAELVWSDGHTVERQVIDMKAMAPHSSHKFRVPFDATGKKWVRFAVWDSAGNGAFTQPVHLK